MGKIRKKPRKNGHIYEIEWIDEHGKRQTKCVSRDRRIAQRNLVRREDEVEKIKAGLILPAAKHAASPIAEQVEDFLAAMEAGNLGRRRRRGTPSPDYVKKARVRLLRAIEEMKVESLGNLTQERVDHLLATMRRDNDAGRRRCSAKTRDDIALLLRQFGDWCVRTGRLLRNPLQDIGRTQTEADITRRRKGLHDAELDRLVEAAEVRPVQAYRRNHPHATEEKLEDLAAAGRARGRLYRFAANTGLRRAECAALRWGDIDTDPPHPAVYVRAETAKNSRTQAVPLMPEIVALLEEHRRELARANGRLPNARDLVFRIPRQILEQITKDALWAELGTLETVGQKTKRVVDARGRVVDFHSLRTTLGSRLARAGVDPRVTRRVMRHSTLATTDRHYTDLELGDLHEGIAQLKTPPETPPRSAPEMATGGNASPSDTERGGVQGVG